jgi:predicted PurR-regulated permease PerM
MKAPEPSKDPVDLIAQETSQRADINELDKPNVRSIALTGIFLILVLCALKLASSFFIPVVLAIVLSFLFASVIRGLHRLYIPPFFGSALIILVLLGGIGFGIYQLASPAREWMVKLPQTLRQIDHKIKGVRQSVQEVTKATQEVDRFTNLDGAPKSQKVEASKAGIGESLLAPTQDFLVGAGTVLILLFFLLASGDQFLRKLVTVLPHWHDKKIAVEIIRQIEHDVSTYLLAISALNLVFGTAVGAAMWLLGMPNPVLWGVMAGFLHFIPFLGALVGISIVTLVAAMTFDGLGAVLAVPAVYFALNVVEEYVILPLVIGKRLLLNPVVVFLWLIFWGWMWNIPGALMAVPLLVIVKIICEHVEPLGAISEFVGR